MTVETPSRRPRNTLIAWTLVPAAVLAALALTVANDERNAAVFLAWNGAATALPPALWAGLTNLGSTTGAFALLAGLLAWYPRWAAAALLAAPPATVFAQGLKEFYDHPRPPAVLAPEQFNVIGEALRTSSFPSGHSTTAFVLAAAVVFTTHDRRASPVIWGALLAAACVAFSRVAVGAHWPQDILAGAAGGWLCGAFGAWWSARWRFWQRARGVRVLAALLGAVSLALFFEELGYPEGNWAQYLLAVWGLTGAALTLRVGTAWSRA